MEEAKGAKVPRRSRKKRSVLLILLASGALALALGAAVLYVLAREAMGGAPAGARLERVQASPRFREGRFVNDEPTRMLAPGGLLESVRMYREPAERVPRRKIPTAAMAPGSFSSPPAGGLRVTWLGHSTFLIELDGARILTDPVLTSRASPFSWVGSERFFPSPVSVGEMPALDAVVVSHDHYDHLAMDEVRELVPKTKAFVVPLGVGAHLERWGVPPEKVVELDWWESRDVAGGVRVTATPARHYSGRGLRRDAMLWASMALLGPSHRVWLSGDTGTTGALGEIGRRLGPFDATIVKIGAYGRAWPDIHLTPEEALEAHRAVRGQLFLPAHWATYNLAAHSWYEPADRLAAAAPGAGVTFAVPMPGQPVVPSDPPPLVRWWDALR